MTKQLAEPLQAGKTSSRRVRSAAASALLVSIELVAIIVAQRSPVLGVVLLVPLAGLQIFAAMRIGGVGAKILVSASSLSIAVAIAAGAAAYVRKDVRYVADSVLLRRGGPLGWTLNPGASRATMTVNGRTIYSQIYTIGADAHRRTIGAGSGPAIAFFGDSFTFGDGVADSATMPQAFADLTDRRFRVLNMGVDAYSPAQVLRAFEAGLFDESLKPAKAFFVMTVDWHAARVACAHESLAGAPRYVSDGGIVRLAGSCPATVPRSTLDRVLDATGVSKLLSGLRRVSDAEVQTYIDVIVTASQLARSKYGVSLRVLYLRNAGYLMFNRFSDDQIMEQLRRRGIPVYDLTLPGEGRGELAIPQDGHPSAIAHRRHAEMLIEALSRTEPDLLVDQR